MNDRRTSLVAVAALLVLLIAAIALAPPADAGEGMERLCFACRDESNFIWGADLAFYTDERGTQTLRIDGATGNIDAEGTLDLAGAATLGGAVTFDGAAVFDGAVAMNSTLDVGGNVASDTGAFTVTDQLFVDGAADAVQLTVQGYTTQTSKLVVLETSAGADKFTVDNSGNVYVDGKLDVSGSVWDSQNDLVLADNVGITGTLEINGAVSDNNSALTIADDVSVSGIVTASEFVGVPRIRLAGVGIIDGAAEVEVDDSPAGEWSALTVSTTVTANTSTYKIGANSLKVAFVADAIAGNGATSAGPDGDWTGMKSIGFWVYADKAFTAAQLVLYLTDATDPATFNTCAYAAPNVWQYCEVDVTSLDGTSGDAVTDIDIRMAAGLPVPINVYVDNMVVWAPADEVSLGVTLQQDGDLGFINALTGASLSPSTDYTIAWRSGVDSIVIVADLDPDGAFGLVAY